MKFVLILVWQILTISKQSFMKMQFWNSHMFPLFPVISQLNELFDQFFLIWLNSAAKTHVFEDLVNEFDLGIVPVE